MPLTTFPNNKSALFCHSGPTLCPRDPLSASLLSVCPSVPFWSSCLPALSVLLDPCPFACDFVCTQHTDNNRKQAKTWT